MDALRAQGIESLAIPHNSNGSNGAMFMRVNWAGEPIDERYAAQRMRNEPLVEVTQVKGTSETHPLLSDTDEWAGFEIMPFRVATKLPSKPEGGYVREAYRTGLEVAADGATNPYKFGLIGSTDTHVGGGSDREETYFSKTGLMDGFPRIDSRRPFARACLGHRRAQACSRSRRHDLYGPQLLRVLGRFGAGGGLGRGEHA
jgi:hypothetical protein